MAKVKVWRITFYDTIFLNLYKHNALVACRWFGVLCSKCWFACFSLFSLLSLHTTQRINFLINGSKPTLYPKSLASWRNSLCHSFKVFRSLQHWEFPKPAVPSVLNHGHNKLRRICLVQYSNVVARLWTVPTSWENITQVWEYPEG